MRAGLTGRDDRLQAVVPEGARRAGGWPRVRFLREGDPEPSTTCPGCGREWHGLTRVFLIERVERDG